MPKITSVEPQTLRLPSTSLRTGRSGRAPKRFNIYLDGTFVFGADEDLVVEHRLVLGKTLTTSDVEKLLYEIEVGKLMERMYRLWNIRTRSEREVKDYLRNLSFKRKIKGKEEISEAAVTLLINKLKQKGLLSDEQFARSWVESRKKKKGPRVLKQELFQKGISKEIVSNVMDQVSNEEEQKTAESLLDRKIRLWKNLSPLEFRKKAYEFLLRRGFEYEVVKDIIEKLFRLR